MMKVKFGEDAGRVWAVLSDGSSRSTKEIKKATKLTDKELYAALGWLAREGKLDFCEEELDVFVRLA